MDFITNEDNVEIYTIPYKETLVEEMLRAIGENPNREGLKGTPKRIVKMWYELFRGYDKTLKPKVTVFNNGTDGLTYDQMVVDEGNYYSHCEHHMVPFFGDYWFAYIPNPAGKILGISKVARIVDFCSAKLQIQERLGKEILDELWNALCPDNSPEPLGMAIVMKGKHLCKSMRGVKKEGLMTTIELRGAFREQADTRAEFLKFVNGRH